GLTPAPTRALTGFRLLASGFAFGVLWLARELIYKLLELFGCELPIENFDRDFTRFTIFFDEDLGPLDGLRSLLDLAMPGSVVVFVTASTFVGAGRAGAPKRAAAL